MTQQQAMTVRLPKQLYERLRLEAYEKHVTQSSIIIGALREHYEQADAGAVADILRYTALNGIGPVP